MACGCAMLPLRTSARGPAPTTQQLDVVDEAIGYYRANVLYRSYDVQGACSPHRPLADGVATQADTAKPCGNSTESAAALLLQQAPSAANSQEGWRE
jgi:hypothetical protein